MKDRDTDFSVGVNYLFPPQRSWVSKGPRGKESAITSREVKGMGTDCWDEEEEGQISSTNVPK